MKRKGTGRKVIDITPSTVEPQPRSNNWNIAGPANGRKAPNIDLRSTLAATAEAEWMPNESTRYVWTGIC
jgi:hypothetical protein